MRKSLLLAAVLGTFAASNVAIAEEAAPESPHSFSYNIGLYSQYIFRG
ncbi:MAG: TorF family putative porin, partial [Methylophilaceae bacterium]|nr:TorF family putative porin [Methylophilaceae bacterium]